jgi:hypothetical protein
MLLSERHVSGGTRSMKKMKISARYRMLLSLTSAWMTGAGLRFIMMKPSEVYTYSVFDKVFDWGIMFVLGLLLFLYTMYRYVVEEKTGWRSGQTNG